MITWLIPHRNQTLLLQLSCRVYGFYSCRDMMFIIASVLKMLLDQMARHSPNSILSWYTTPKSLTSPAHPRIKTIPRSHQIRACADCRRCRNVWKARLKNRSASLRPRPEECGIHCLRAWLGGCLVGMVRSPISSTFKPRYQAQPPPQQYSFGPKCLAWTRLWPCGCAGANACLRCHNCLPRAACA